MSPEPDVLRALVRELLTETLGGAGHTGTAATLGSLPPGASPPPAVDEAVTIRSDAELDAFVRHLLSVFEDPRRREAVRAGRLRFRLAGGGAPPAARGGDPVRLDRGALTEKAVAAAAREGRSIVLGRRAVATPLALDKARSLGIGVRREAT